MLANSAIFHRYLFNTYFLLNKDLYIKFTHEEYFDIVL